MSTRTIVPLLAVLLALAAPSGATQAPPGGDDYLRALALARRGETARAVSLLERLAAARPASVPVHRDLARLVLAARDPSAVRALSRQMRRRLRRTSRDVGANVAMALLEAARGNRGAAHRHLLTALTAGCRDPLLVPLLLATSPSPGGLLSWLARRRAVIPGDAAFRALEARALLAMDRVGPARRVLDEGLRRDPEHPDLLSLRAELYRVEGREGRACEMAQVALGFLASRPGIPESRVPLRVVLARVLGACGRAADAEAVLAGLGPLLTPPGGPPLEPLADLGRAEVALSGEDPLRALAILGFRPADPGWVRRFPPGEGSAFAGLVHPRAWARSIAGRALAMLALPGTDRLLPSPPPGGAPGGLGLGDREELLAARLCAGTPVSPGRIQDLARALDEAGLVPRAFRLRLAAAARGAGPVPEDVPPGDPDLLLARTIAAALPGFPRDTPDELVLAPAHGRLRAAFRAGRAAALAAAGRWGEVRQTCREGLLDLEEATRTTRPLPPELGPLLDAWGPATLVLPGLAARAGHALRMPPRRLAGDLLHDLGRAARAWSRIESPWPRQPADLALPPGTCLVLATPAGPGAVTAALAAGREPSLVPGDGSPLDLPPCRGARVILWAGPATPESRGIPGLGPPGGPLVVRVPHPGDPVLPEIARPRSPGSPAPVGAGPASPLGKLVEGLVGRVPGPEGTGPPGVPSGWLAFAGTGIAPARAPASAGWLVPTALADRGWLSPESLRSLPPGGPGLVSLGVLVPPAGTEPAARLLAESALLAGRGWALLSREPLGPGEQEAVRRALARAGGRAPLAPLHRLVTDRPQLAARLELWTVASRVHPGYRPMPPAGLVLAGLAVILGVALVLAVVRRRRGRGKVNP